MTTFEIIFVSASLGMLFGSALAWLAYRRRLSDLEFNNDMLLDFHERLVRNRESIESQMKAQDEIVDAYCKHLETHECRLVEKEEEWPEIIY